MLRNIIFLCVLCAGLPSYAACAKESQLSYVRSQGVEISASLTVAQVEKLTDTGVVNGHLGEIRPYDEGNTEWQALKAKWKKGDYFVQFKRGQALVERTKFYMDGLFLVRSGCVAGWLKWAIS